jgi:hypothetical protein
LQLSAEHGVVVLVEIELRVTAKDLKPIRGIPVHFRMDGPPIEDKSWLDEVVEVVRHHIDRLDGFERRHVCDDVRKPDIRRADSVDAGVVP